ncbi:solute carrier family 13 member 1-like isoform X1 [Rhinatrema bivittatum]|uniref:solute carrier family 13 member 1-like isoform X1 n=1 Tax=Rhinatrema bivittatum TaxID=194408 RepID=UPI00112B992C|nr:solute carrier family 13 member 1-like isoform X1 [Rhinatrema bivittatum]
MANSLFQHLWQQKDAVIIFLFPLLLLPFPLLVQTQEAACAYILLVTAAYWISEAIPLGAAAMVPAFLFPLFGIMKSSEVAAEYLKDIHLLLFGVVCLAASIQKWNLHRRIALWMVLSVGGHPSWLLLGFMSCTALLSMWLSNTSTAAMVMPIVDAVLCQLSGAKPEERALSELAAKDLDASKIDLPISPESNILDYCTDNNQVCSSAFSWTLKECPPEKIFSLQEEQTFQTQRPSKQGKRLYRTEQDHMTCKAFSLGIAYSSTVGGMTTLTGTSTNLIFLEQFETRYPDCQIINFGTWIAFSFPIALIILLLSWMWINWLFLGFSFKDMCCYKKGSKSETDSRKILKQEYSKLGPLSYPEVVTLVVFLLMALSWFTRDPGFIPGWDSLFGPKGYKSDATSAVLFGFLLFIIPGKKPKAFSFRSSDKSEEISAVPKCGPMIIWKEFEQCMPWNIVILVGGGFALAKGCEVSGLSVWVGKRMEVLSSLPVWIIVLLVCLMVTTVTEVASNPATITIFQPILSSLAEVIGINPLLIIIPATISASCAYLLPVANPPNAIVFTYGHLTMQDMIKTGLGVNLISIVSLFFGLYTWGIPMFNLNTFPEWVPMKNVTSPSP